jgi:hypothetical protein
MTKTTTQSSSKGPDEGPKKASSSSSSTPSKASAIATNAEGVLGDRGGHYRATGEPMKMPELWPGYSGNGPSVWASLSRQEQKDDRKNIRKNITGKGRRKLPQAYVDASTADAIKNKYTWMCMSSDEQKKWVNTRKVPQAYFDANTADDPKNKYTWMNMTSDDRKKWQSTQNVPQGYLDANTADDPKNKYTWMNMTSDDRKRWQSKRKVPQGYLDANTADDPKNEYTWVNMASDDQKKWVRPIGRPRGWRKDKGTNGEEESEAAAPLPPPPPRSRTELELENSIKSVFKEVDRLNRLMEGKRGNGGPEQALLLIHYNEVKDLSGGRRLKWLPSDARDRPLVAAMGKSPSTALTSARITARELESIVNPTGDANSNPTVEFSLHKDGNAVEYSMQERLLLRPKTMKKNRKGTAALMD